MMYVYLVWKNTPHSDSLLYLYRTREKAQECLERCIANNKRLNLRGHQDITFNIEEREVTV